jgi:hypothetical protein
MKSAANGGLMSGRRLCIVFLATVTALSGSATAQKNELAGGIGRTLLNDLAIQPGTTPLLNNFVRFGSGTTFEINYARHLKGNDFARLDLEVPFVGNPDEDLGSGNAAVPSSYASYFVTPAVRGKIFAENTLQFWASVGGGLGHFGVSDKLVYGGNNPGRSKTSALLQFGYGMDVKIKGPFGLRVAARNYWSSALPFNVETGQSHQHSLVVTGGAYWRF